MKTEKPEGHSIVPNAPQPEIVNVRQCRDAIVRWSVLIGAVAMGVIGIRASCSVKTPEDYANLLGYYTNRFEDGSLLPLLPMTPAPEDAQGISAIDEDKIWWKDAGNVIDGAESTATPTATE